MFPSSSAIGAKDQGASINSRRRRPRLGQKPAAPPVADCVRCRPRWFGVNTNALDSCALRSEITLLCGQTSITLSWSFLDPVLTPTSYHYFRLEACRSRRLDLPSRCFTLPDSEYQACSPAHVSGSVY